MNKLKELETKIFNYLESITNNKTILDFVIELNLLQAEIEGELEDLENKTKLERDNLVLDIKRDNPKITLTEAQTIANNQVAIRNEQINDLKRQLRILKAIKKVIHFHYNTKES